MIEAVSYLRTSSSANEAGDSHPRQRKCIADYAANANYRIVKEFTESGVSGTVDLKDRAVFLSLVNHAKENKISHILVERGFSRSPGR